MDDGFWQELAGLDLYPDFERDIPSLEITQITSLALSDTEFSNLVANGQYEDVYGVVVKGSYSDASNLANAIIHFETRDYYNEEQTSYTIFTWQAEITHEDIDAEGNFNVTFFAPQNPINKIGQFDEVHVGDVLVVDEYGTLPVSELLGMFTFSIPSLSNA